MFPLPIRTPRLLIRPKQIGDGASTAAAVAETWDELHKWMRWAESREAFTAESMEIRNRHVMASFILRESIELLGLDAATGEAVIWCGFHDIDWQGRQCELRVLGPQERPGPGVRNRDGKCPRALCLRRARNATIGLTHSRGNEASRRIAEKLGFALEGVQRDANILPGEKTADRFCYSDSISPDSPTWM